MTAQKHNQRDSGIFSRFAIMRHEHWEAVAPLVWPSA